MLALDIGGTKLAAALIDVDGRVTSARRSPTPPRLTSDAEQLWSAVAAIADGVLVAAGRPRIAGVGIGCGGPMRWPAGVVSTLNIQAWRDFPLRDRVAERFPGVPVRLHNDAPCLAAAEHWRGAGRGSTALLGMVVSTGVGGGLVLGGRLVDGPTGNAGHIGHVIVDPAGPACACGGSGCLEAIASGPSIAAWVQQQGWPGDTTASDVADAGRRGDPLAVAAFDRAGTALGTAIASATALCDLDMVVLGGGVPQAGRLLLDPLDRALRRHARLGFTRRVQVVPAGLGQEAGLVGAAALVLAGDRYWSAD